MKLPDDPGLVSGAGFFASALDWARKVTRNFNPLHDQVEALDLVLDQVLLDLKGPAFKAYRAADVAIAINATTASVLDAEVYDTASCFNTANGRFTPNVAGYYQFNFSTLVNFAPGGQGTNCHAILYRNGVEVARGAQFVSGAGSPQLGFWLSTGSDLQPMNGTTDYVQLGVTNSALGGAPVLMGVSQSYTHMSGHLARRL